MCMMKLAKKTITAETRMTSHKAVSGIILCFYSLRDPDVKTEIRNRRPGQRKMRSPWLTVERTLERFKKCCSHRPVAGLLSPLLFTMKETAHRAVATTATVLFKTL